MKKAHKKMRFISFLVIVMMAVATMSMAAQPTVDLGTTSEFAVLAGTTITNTGTTIIDGNLGANVGLFPGSAFTGQGGVTVNGNVYLADTIASVAKDDLIVAYDDADGSTPVNRIATELGGTTLTPGTYDSVDGTFQITGTLTLDAQGDPNGVFLFKTAGLLNTASGSNVRLINSARFSQTFWKVGSSATLGTNSHFVGHIFALTSISAATGATVQGQLLARNGEVTLDNNTIINGVMDAPASLHVIKHVINDNGSNAVAANFNLHVKNSGIDVVGSPAPGAEAPGSTYMLAAGNYQVSEDVYGGYTTSYSGDSDANGNITLAPGDEKTVIITNDDVRHHSGGGGQSPQNDTPLIKLIKIPEPLALPFGQGWVTYTYKVTNPGLVELSNVSVTDDKVSPVNYVSGDVNADGLLQPSETWIYTTRMHLTATTTNTATTKGSANGMTATDIAVATVVVTPPVVVTPTVPGEAVTPVVSGEVVTPAVSSGVVTKTVTGGQLPKTSSNLYELLLIGVALTLVGALGWKSRKRYE